MSLGIFWQSVFVEFGPVMVFFLGTCFFDFFTGVALLVASTALSIAVSLISLKRVPLFSLIVSCFVLVSGILTLITHDPYFVAIEYTISNLAFGVVLIAGFFAGKGLLQPLFDGMFALTPRGWRILSLRWGFFFILVAVGSELVWRLHSYDAWVLYRFIGMFALMLFGCSQFFLARRERQEDASTWGVRISK
jgi:intracellular septation protein